MQPRAVDAGYAPCWNFYLRSFLLWKTFLQVQQQTCYVLWICSKMLTLSLLEGSRSGNPGTNGVFGKPEVTGYRGSCTACLCAGATGSSLPCPTQPSGSSGGAAFSCSLVTCGFSVFLAVISKYVLFAAWKQKFIEYFVATTRQIGNLFCFSSILIALFPGTDRTFLFSPSFSDSIFFRYWVIWYSTNFKVYFCWVYSWEKNSLWKMNIYFNSFLGFCFFHRTAVPSCSCDSIILF